MDNSFLQDSKKDGLFSQILRRLGSVETFMQNHLSINHSSPVIQIVEYQTGAVATGATVIPVDDTIPQITEGDEYLSLSITPTRATNKLKISIVCILASNVSTEMVVALFINPTLDAIAASTAWIQTVSAPFPIPLQCEVVAGTTSPITFKVRCGGNAIGTTTLNGWGGVRKYGGVLSTSIRITEIRA